MNKKTTKGSADKAYLKSLSFPGLSQVQVMARAGKFPPEAENFTAILEGILDRTRNTASGDWSDVEFILHSQISMLNMLSSHFMIKAIAGYEAPEVLQAFPQIPLELANLSLKCQIEMRKCVVALCEIKNPKKPATFIKNYVNQQLNQLQVEQEEIKQRLEATNHAQVEFRSARKAEGVDTEMEAVESQCGSGDVRGESD